MERPTIIDASVGVKLVSQEELSAEADALLLQHIEGNMSVVIPTLFYYEVGNALRYKNAPQQLINRAFQDLMQFQFHTQHLDHKLLTNTLNIALQFNLTFYDAAYLALADAHNGFCITCDKKMLASKHPLVKPLLPS